MPVRPCVSRGNAAWRWGRHGSPFTFGHGTGRTSHEAANLAARQGRRKAVRQLVNFQRNRGDSRASRKAQARKRRAFKGDGPRFSGRIEAMLEKMLRDRVGLVERLFLEFAGPAISDFQADLDARRQDAIRALDILQVLAILRAVLPKMATDDEEGLRFIGSEIDDDVTTATERDLSRIFNIPLAIAAGSEAAILTWIRTNVELIKSLMGKALDQIERMVSQAMSSGTPTRTLAKDIQKRFDVSRSKASLIARDQTAKLASRINQERQTSFGITKYTWSTSGDERVRPGHVALDGTIQEWANPPEIPGTATSSSPPRTAHPGEDFQCRCDAIPVRPGADETVLLAEAEELKERELQILMVSPTVRGEIPNRSQFSNWNKRRLTELSTGLRSAVGL